MKDPQNLQAALVYSQIGWPVFPIRFRDKTPLTAHGFHDATVEASLIRRWWDANPDAGVGIATGASSHLLVLDVDPRNGGDDSLATLLAQHGDLPYAPESQTGGGGRHIFFHHPGGIVPGAKGLWPGIDVKSDGGYVVVPFSIHPSGFAYQWKENKDPEILPPPPPPWLLEALTKRQRTTRICADGERVIPEGRRNDALASLAGTMHRRGMDPEAILAALLAENMAKCQPPLPEEEVARIVGSITSNYAPDEQASPSVPAAAANGTMFQFVDAELFATTEPPEIQWILEGRLARGDCGIISGPPAVGKSWITLEMGVAGPTGRPIFGRFLAPILKKVLIVDEENTRWEVHRRIRHLAKAWGIAPGELAGKLFLSRPCQGFTFGDKAWTVAMARQVAELKPDLIILDSITALAGIKDDADAINVRAFFHEKLYPIRALSDAAILCIHHTNKQVYKTQPDVSPAGMVRGSIDYLAAVDCAFLLTGGKGTLSMATLKVRSGEAPEPLRLQLVNGTEGGVRPVAVEAGPDPMERTRPGSKAATIRSEILEVLHTSGRPLLPEELKTWLKLRAQGEIDLPAMKNVVSRMLSDGTLVRLESGRLELGFS